MRRIILVLALCFVAPCTFAGDGPTPTELKQEKENVPTPIPKEYTGGEKRPSNTWKRTGPLGETPKRITDAYPLTDQKNKQGWVKYEPMSDEFEGEKLDPNKWLVGGEVWSGRQPGWFSGNNVTVSDGKLHLTMRKEEAPPHLKKHGFGDISCASLYSKGRSAHGYYEVLAKPMNSAGSSAFFFQREEKPGWLTEIDVFEIGGNSKDWQYSYNMNLHVWKTHRTKQNWYLLGIWVAPFRLADDYHVYGLEWGKDKLIFYVDGVPVYKVENTHWHQPLRMIFDSETMPDWLGLPDYKDLPSTFSIEYVRAWKKKEK